ncbi:MAG: PrsW family glutamic-type intramembrane protease [Dehalococcoidia bacterium]
MRRRSHLLAAALALAGGIFGVLGALIEEVQAGFLVPFVAAPIIEEALKPSGVYLLLGKWPHLLRGRLYTAYLAALGGVSFAVIENIIYLTIYFPEHSGGLVLYRFTVALFMHSLASFIVGLGINQRLLASVRGEVPLLAGNKKFFFSAIVLHALYNIGATVAQASGLLKF